MHKNTLYISFDGLSDPLGQSQILPYLCGIAAQGFAVHILSCEKPERLKKEKHTIALMLGSLPITWEYILYDEQAGSLSRLSYVRRIQLLAKRTIQKKKIELVHCRSYLASIIGLVLKRTHKIPFVFDMRGFWADERIDGGIWRRGNYIHDLFYTYFKKKEKQFLLYSDAVISLTHAAVRVLENQYPEAGIQYKTTVIPCCVNTDLFSHEAIPLAKPLASVLPGDHVLVYTGSVGTWYYTRQMIDCILVWKEYIPTIKLLIVTRDTLQLEQILASYSPDTRRIIISASSAHKDVASYLALAKASVFFIKPSYSKIASSPTKMAECWAMDLPIITNVGIGDNDLYFNEHQGGILVKEFTKEEYTNACLDYLALSRPPGFYRKIALRHFDTKTAVTQYVSIYKSLTS